MVDLNVYRVRIGTFQNKCHKTKSRRTLFQSKMSSHQHSVGRGPRFRTLVLLCLMTGAVVVCIPLLHQERDSAVDETLHPAVRMNREHLNQVTDPLVSCLWNVYQSIVSCYRNGWLSLKPSAVSCDSVIHSYANGWTTLPPSAVSCDSAIDNYTYRWMTLSPSAVSCDSVIDNYTNRWMTLPPSAISCDSAIDNYTNKWMTLPPSAVSCDSVIDNYTNRWMTLPPSAVSWDSVVDNYANRWMTLPPSAVSWDSVVDNYPNRWMTLPLSAVSCDSVIDNYTNGWMTLSPSAISCDSNIDNYTNGWMTLPPSAVSYDSVVDNNTNRWMTLPPSAVSYDSVVDNYTNGWMTLSPSSISCDSNIDNYTNGWMTLPPSAVSCYSMIDNYTNRWMTLPPSAVSCDSAVDNYTNRWMTLPPSAVSCDSVVDIYANGWMTLPPSAAFYENDMCPVTENQSQRTCSYLIGNSGLHAYNGNPPMHGGEEEDIRWLHHEMINKLSGHVHPGMGNSWDMFLNMLQVYFTPQEVSDANNIFKVCNTLEMKGRIKPGQYGLLKQLFNSAGLKQCCEIVEEYSQKIEGIRRKPLPLSTTETVYSQDTTETEYSQGTAETVHNQATAETVHSQATAETVHSQATAEAVHNQASAETVHSQDTAETVHNQATAETVHSQATAETVHSQDSPETVHSQATAETVHSQATAETVHSQATAETVHSQDSPETVHSQDSPETVHSQGTTETVHSQATGETVHSQATAETEYSQDTAETVHSQATAETIHSRDTAETVHSQDSPETVHSQDSPETVHSQGTTETVHSQATGETVHSQDTAETIHSQATAETVHGQATAETVHSQATAETVHSQDTAESVHSQATTETVYSRDTTASSHNNMPSGEETRILREVLDALARHATGFGAAESVYSRDTAASSHNKMPSVDMEASVKVWRNNDKLCYETKGIKDVVQKICSDEHSYICVVGEPGCGKSTAIRHAALYLKDKFGFIIYPVSGPKQFIDYLDPDKPQVFIFDDFCGEYFIDQDKLKAWGAYNEKIKDWLQVHKNTKVLFSLRVQLYSELKSKGNTHIYNDQRHILNFSDKEYKLGRDTMEDMLRHYLQVQHVQNIEGLIRRVWWEEAEQFAGCFPLLCKVFSEDESVRIVPGKYFRDPLPALQNIFKRIKSDNKHQFCGLLLCGITDLKDEYFSPLSELSKPKHFNLLIKSQKLDPDTDLDDIKQALNNLDGVYISHIGNRYTFLHSIFQNIVTFLYDDKYYVFKYATLDFIDTRVRLFSKFDTDDDYVKVFYGDDCVELLVDRMIEELRSDDTYRWEKGARFIVNSHYIDNKGLIASLMEKLFDSKHTHITQYKIDELFGECLKTVCIYKPSPPHTHVTSCPPQTDVTSRPPHTDVTSCPPHTDVTSCRQYQLLLSLIARCDCNKQIDWWPRYPLHFSVYFGAVPVTKALVEHQADVNVVDGKHKHCVLHLAVDCRNNVDMTKYLLSLPNLKCLNHRDLLGHTPYWYVVNIESPGYRFDDVDVPHRDELMKLYKHKAAICE